MRMRSLINNKWVCESFTERMRMILNADKIERKKERIKNGAVVRH